MSLISHSIEAMGDQLAAGSLPPAVSSISLRQSVADWWNSSRHLMGATTNTASYHRARLHHLVVEYELYRAILSEKIHLVKPKVSPNVSAEKVSSPVSAQLLDTYLDDTTFIHEIHLVNSTDTSLPRKEVVVIHGYMAASAYFVKNLEQMVMAYGNLLIHVLDMPGFGNSARPTFPRELLVDIGSRVEHIRQILDVENWFIDKFEAWRIKRNIAKFRLVAHSMGGYLLSCYLMKYNTDHRVEHFVNVSPMGTELSLESLINHKDLQFNHHAGGDPLQEIFQEFHEENHPDLEKLWERLGRPKFPKNLILRKVWQWHLLPFQLLQHLGPLYSKILSYWLFQRFKNLKANDQLVGDNTPMILKLHNYSFSIFNQYQGLGELAITKLINHEILARVPLCDRGFMEYIHDHDVKTLWMYGDKDWMNFQGGQYCVDKLRQLGGHAEFHIVPDAGHHIYLDNPRAFNDIVIDFLELRQK